MWPTFDPTVVSPASPQAEHSGETEMSQRTLTSEEDVITSGEALFMFRDLRQEVTVLAQLDHPYIVALLGELLPE